MDSASLSTGAAPPLINGGSAVPIGAGGGAGVLVGKLLVLCGSLVVYTGRNNYTIIGVDVGRGVAFVHRDHLSPYVTTTVLCPLSVFIISNTSTFI